MARTRFTAGDFIEVTSKSTLYGDESNDFGSIRGTALHTVGYTGPAAFSVRIKTGPGKETDVEFNINYVEVTTLFRADLARSAGRGNTLFS